MPVWRPWRSCWPWPWPAHRMAHWVPWPWPWPWPWPAHRMMAHGVVSMPIVEHLCRWRVHPGAHLHRMWRSKRYPSRAVHGHMLRCSGRHHVRWPTHRVAPGGGGIRSTWRAGPKRDHVNWMWRSVDWMWRSVDWMWRPVDWIWRSVDWMRRSVDWMRRSEGHSWRAMHGHVHAHRVLAGVRVPWWRRRGWRRRGWSRSRLRVHATLTMP